MLRGRYRLDRRISSGGMGEVWAALDTLLDRTVAVKLLRDELASRPGFRERFRDEARALAALAHPSVVAVYDYDEQDGTAFLAMELVDGEPLSARVRRGSLGVTETMAVVAQAAAALAAAHAAGLVHRDVKPANLLLRADGRLVVTDFGIARLLDDPSRTEVGTVVGTVTYMSPEQLRGSPVTPASDLYSLGVVAYECLTGTRLFSRRDSIAVAMAHLYEPVPAMPPDVPAPVQELVTALLQKDPAQRPASAADVAATASQLGGVTTWPPVAVAVPGTATARIETATATAPFAAPTGTAAAPTAPFVAADTTASQVSGVPGAQERTTVAPLPLPRPVEGERRPGDSQRPGTGTLLHAWPRWPAWWPVPARRGAVAVALLSASVAVLLIGLAASGVLGGGQRPEAATVTVPRLTANPVGSAISRLRSLGLRSAATSADVPGHAANVVVAQHPAAGRRVRRGSRIVLTVASGYVTLPAGRLDGQPAATATADLERLGLQVSAQATPSATPAGDVVSFTPSGRLAEGTTVTLVVATAPPTTAAPPTPSPPSPGNGGGNGHGKGHGQHQDS